MISFFKKIKNKITKNSLQNDSETSSETKKKLKEIARERSISPEKRQPIIDEPRLIQ